MSPQQEDIAPAHVAKDSQVYDSKNLSDDKFDNTGVSVVPGHTDDLDILPANEEAIAKHDFELDEEELEALESKLSSMSVERATAIAEELFKTHKNDQNFPKEVLDLLNEFTLYNHEICNDPLKNADIIRRVKIECLLATENSPYLEVRANTESTDDPTIPALTFRVLFIGTIFAGAGSFVDTLFAFRQPPVYVGTAVGQLIAYPFGKFLAKVLPTHKFHLFGREVSFNPGRFNRKEHMLITLMCNVSLGSPYTTYIIPVQALPQFFNQPFAYSRGYQILNTIGTTFVGYGLAGMLRRFLVWPSFAVWPGTFSNMALIKAFHSEDNTPVRGPFGKMWSMSREKFFLITFLIMAVYYWIPGYLFTALSEFSWISWISPNNTTLDAITGMNGGMGINPWPTFDWNVASTVFTPLTLPTFTVVNIFVSMVFATIAVFGMWWTNVWNTGYLPINSNNTWDNTGNLYNVSAILTPEGNFDYDAYQQYSEPWMSAGFAIGYVFYFIMYTATLTYVALFHRYEVTQAFKGFWKSVRRPFKRSVPDDELDLSEDIHYRLMKQNYKDVPEYVYMIVLLISAAIGMIGVGIYPSNTSPVVVIYGIVMPVIAMIPCGLIQAVTGLPIPTNVIAEFIGGSLVSGNADALMYFKTYGYISMSQALLFCNDLKLAHYSKLPPWSTFTVQMWASLIYSIVSALVFNFVLGLRGVCTEDAVFQFTCPGQTVYFTASVFWGTLSPKRLFGAGKRYNGMLVGFPVGVVLVLVYWALRKKFPKSALLRQVHPVLLCEGPVYIASPYNLSWYTTSVYITVFSFQYIRKRYTQFWAKYNYVLAASFSCGVAVSAVIIFFGLYVPNGGISLEWWGNTVSGLGCEGQGGCARLGIPTDPGYFGGPPGTYT